ncbi:hypothetical protein [Thermogymnomonas acidicola]|uniref:hypothetical protein n=1 Tax=Thermogymnomonas acidicola TaxID=399579 RepID=UPI0009462D34|nr:hypothetical protein [Thermogymnomonas acidicola]
MEHGVRPEDFNSYGARRGNHEVMMRGGTFGNNRIKNALAGREGPYTKYLPAGEVMFVYDAAVKYMKEGVPLVVFAGKEYGSGSSRDWAAKGGPMLIGVKAVVARSFERIHRSNLIGMGILPLQFPDGQDINSIKADTSKPFTIDLRGALKPGGRARMRFTTTEGKPGEVVLTVRLDTPIEVEYYRHGGILQFVMRKILTEAKS